MGQTLPAFVLGLQAAFSAYAISIILFFVILMSFIGKTKDQIITAGLFFINAVFLTSILTALGYYDHFFNEPGVFEKVLLFYLALAVLFCAVGVLNLIDWFGYKRSGDINRFIVKLPTWFYASKFDGTFLNKGRSLISLLIRNALVMFLSTAFGWAMTVLGYFWWPDYAVFVMIFHFMQEGHRNWAWLSVVLYATAVILPLSFVWLCMVMRMHSKKRPALRPASVSMFKIFSSSLFLSLGVGLLFVYLI